MVDAGKAIAARSISLRLPVHTIERIKIAANARGAEPGMLRLNSNLAGALR